MCFENYFEIKYLVLLAKRIQYLLHFSVLYVVQKSFLGLRYFVNRIQKTYHKVCFKSANPRYWCSNQDPNAENGAENTAGIIKMQPVFLPYKIGDSPKPTKTSFELNKRNSASHFHSLPQFRNQYCQNGSFPT